MFRIGLISEHPTKPKRRFFGEYTKEVVLNEQNPFELVAVTVPFSKTQLEAMSEKRRRKVMTKARGILNDVGAEKIFLSPFIKQIAEDDGLGTEIEAERQLLFQKWAYPCVKGFAEKCGICLMTAKVCIRDSKMERITENLIGKLCYDTKNLMICTHNRQKAQQVCEDFFDETGMAVKVGNMGSGADADVVIDVDEGKLRIGRDLVIDGAAMEFVLDGFPPI